MRFGTEKSARGYAINNAGVIAKYEFNKVCDVPIIGTAPNFDIIVDEEDSGEIVTNKWNGAYTKYDDVEYEVCMHKPDLFLKLIEQLPRS